MNRLGLSWRRQVAAGTMLTKPSTDTDRPQETVWNSVPAVLRNDDHRSLPAGHSMRREIVEKKWSGQKLMSRIFFYVLVDIISRIAGSQ